MWKKGEDHSVQPAAQSAPKAPAPEPARTETATIGPSIVIRGDVTGGEDILIRGRVEGSVILDEYRVGVGPEGRVNADITGRVIAIEGRVQGNLTAQDQIVLRGSAHVEGDIKAPRLVLEDGATFRGLVDMGGASGGDSSSLEAPDDDKVLKAEGSSKPDAKREGGAAGAGRAKRPSRTRVAATTAKGEPERMDQATA